MNFFQKLWAAIFPKLKAEANRDLALLRARALEIVEEATSDTLKRISAGVLVNATPTLLRDAIKHKLDGLVEQKKVSAEAASLLNLVLAQAAPLIEVKATDSVLGLKARVQVASDKFKAAIEGAHF